MMQAGGRGGARPPIGIAFEGDLGNRIDAVLAVAMLNGLAAKTEARRISLSVSRSSLKAAQLADVLVRFYLGGPSGGREGVPAAANPATIGMPESGPSADDSPLVTTTLGKTAADGTPVYASAIRRTLDTADNCVLMRNTLLAQNDGNAIIVLAGQATGLARLLDLFGSRPQIESKVKQVVVAIGSFPAGPADPAITSDLAAARKLFAEWPTPLLAVGSEVGDALPYPGATIDKDFTWAPAHPVADAYRAFKAMPYDAPAPALAAILAATHPDDGFFTLSETGTITVLDNGRTQFTAGADGRHRYLKVDPAQKERIQALYAALVAAPPAPRPGRGRGAAAAALDQNAPVVAELADL